MTEPRRAPLPDAWWRLSLSTRRQIAAGVVLVIVLVVAFVLTRGDDDEPDPFIFVAELPDERVAQWDQLAECESGGDWSDDTGNGFYGGLQFTQESWDGVGGDGSPAAAPRDEQIMRAEFLYDLQGWDAWPVCSVDLGFQ